MQIEIPKRQFPLAQLHLEAGESARIQRGSMIYHTPSIRLETHLNGSGRGLGRIMSTIGRSLTSGESSLMTTAVAEEKGTIAIAPNLPGSIYTLECSDEADRQYFINDGKFLAMSENADYKMHRQSLTKGFLSGTGGMFIMQTIGEGQVLVNSFGSIFRLHVEDDEMTIDNDHVVAWSDTLNYNLHMESGFFQGIGTGEGIVNTFRGTGDIFIQSLNMTTFADNLDPFLPDNSSNN